MSRERNFHPRGTSETTRRTDAGIQKKKEEQPLTHVSEVDDRDFALAEKGLASVRDHGRAGAITHPDNWRLLGNRSRFLLHRIAPFFRSLSISLSMFASQTDCRSRLSRSFSSSFLLSISLSPSIRRSESDGKKKNTYAASHLERAVDSATRYKALTTRTHWNIQEKIILSHRAFAHSHTHTHSHTRTARF